MYQYLSPLVALPIAVAVAKKLNDDQVIGIIKKEAEEDAITTIQGKYLETLKRGEKEGRRESNDFLRPFA